MGSISFSVINKRRMGPVTKVDSFLYSVAVDDKYGDIGALNAFQVSNKETGHSLILYDSSTTPLILSMDLGWTIELVAIL